MFILRQNKKPFKKTHLIYECIINNKIPFFYILVDVVKILVLDVLLLLDCIKTR